MSDRPIADGITQSVQVVRNGITWEAPNDRHPMCGYVWLQKNGVTVTGRIPWLEWVKLTTKLKQDIIDAMEQQWRKTMNLVEGLHHELIRAKDALKLYEDLGPVGAFGAMMIKSAITKGEKSLGTGDVSEMLAALEELKGVKI